MADEIRLKDMVKYDPASDNFVIAHDVLTVQDVNEYLAEVAARGGANDIDQLMALATTVVEPIDQALPYKMVFTNFYNEVTLEDLEDPSFPVESQVMAIAFEVHPESEVFFVRPSLEWYRPTLKEYSAGVEIPWKLMRRAGWNILNREMRRATDAIARRIDIEARNALDAAVLATSGHSHTETSSTLQKSTVDALIKAAHTEGFPMVRAAINSGTVTDMVGWSSGVFNANLPPEEAREMLRTLHLGEYGGVNWYSSPFVRARYIYFGGDQERTGWHITRGRTITSSDVDIRKGIDLHAIRSAEHAFYVDNAYNVRRIYIAG